MKSVLVLLLICCILFTSCAVVSNIGAKQRLEQFEQRIAEQESTAGIDPIDKTTEYKVPASDSIVIKPEAEPERASRILYAAADTDGKTAAESAEAALEYSYVCNANTKRFHRPDCSSVSEIKEKNRRDFTGSREELISSGYVPCKRCNP